MSTRFYFKDLLENLKKEIDKFSWPMHFNLSTLEMAVYVINRMELHAEERFEINSWQISEEIEFLSHRASEIHGNYGQNSTLDAVIFLGLSIAAEANKLLEKQSNRIGQEEDDD